ncbi:MAG: UDP-N-acetylmuramoyl-tripeptide--D-alanyl-D-alanine ligase [Verrucomicrobiales bacterium]
MKQLTLQQICEWTEGELFHGDPAGLVAAVSTDTRTLSADALFVALQGEKYDAHDFLDQAFDAGAAAALVSRESAPAAAAKPMILVADTLVALQRLASRYRDTLLPFVAVTVTGSNGKTSTKDFLSSILSRRFEVNATKGNLNNHIGLPLTVLATDARHSAGVWEIGMNHVGEIAPLARIAKPDLAVITNIGTAHIEFMGSRAAIAQEKGKLAEAVPDTGCVVLNSDDNMTPDIALRTRARVLRAGFSGGDVTAANVSGTGFELVVPGTQMVRGRIPVQLSVPGRHMINNALLAAATGLFLGLSLNEIKEGLESARIHGGRLERKIAAGLHFIDDSYNANPDSMKAALATLATLPCAGRRLAVLGRMGELGSHSKEGHEAVGRAARLEEIDFLLTVGNGDARLIYLAFDDPARSRHFKNHAGAANFLQEKATRDDLILVKGSRAAGMEKVIGLIASSQTTSAA